MAFDSVDYTSLSVPAAPFSNPSRIPDFPKGSVPRHVGVIMDGNGRWAQQRGLIRTEGHQAAEPVVFDTIAGAIEAGVRYLSLYTFSTENWKRSPSEVRFLMGFSRDIIHRRVAQMDEWGVRDEAIRPTEMRRETVPGDARTQKLYALIRNRTLATQMADAKIDRTTATINISGRQEKFVAKGEVVVFDGFLKVYGTSKDELLPPLAVGDQLRAHEIVARQTFSRPPARYTEGSLVKKLEELEIGRPSTYATILTNIQQRGYAVKGESEGVEREVTELVLVDGKVSERTVTEKTGATKGKLVPTDAGMVVADFLSDYFNDIVDYQFTAKVEKELDDIAANKLDKVQMLRTFYDPFHAKIKESGGIDRSVVAGQRLVGIDPKDEQPIYARLGRFGPMLQKGDSNQPDAKVTFANMPAGASVDTVTLEQALKMFSLPRTVGQTADGQEIIANIGRFGPYIKVGKLFVSIKPDSPFEITEDKARELYQAKLDAEAAKHINQWGDIQALNGRYGPYITDGTKNVKIPKDLEPKEITEEQAKEILAKAPTRKPTRRTAARKTTAKKTTVKKTTARKTATNKQ